MGGLGGGLGFGLGGALTSGFTESLLVGGFTATMVTGVTVGGLGSELSGGNFLDGALQGAAYSAGAFTASATLGYAYTKVQSRNSELIIREAVIEESVSVDANDGPGAPNKVPNPGGRLGGSQHREMVLEYIDKLAAKGWDVKAEFYMPGEGPGTKGAAFADVYATKGDKVIILQVGKQTKTTLIPISRERANLIKIREIMGPRDPGKFRALFKAYNQSQ
jgi:hypothetical protein